MNSPLDRHSNRSGIRQAPPGIGAMLTQAVTLTRAVLALLGMHRGYPLDQAGQQQIEDAIRELLSTQQELKELVDADGALHNGLIDVVRQLRSGNPGAAFWVLDQLCKKLEACQAEWGRHTLPTSG